MHPIALIVFLLLAAALAVMLAALLF